MSGERGYIRWTPANWQIVAASAIPYLDKGKSVPQALALAQRALPKDRRRSEEELKGMPWQQSTKKYIAEARALSPEKRAEIAPPPPPRAKPAPRKSADEGRNYSESGTKRWTTLERAKVARKIKQWRDAGDTRSLSRLIIEAQELVIEPDRRRAITSIQSGTTGGKNQQLYEEGLKNIWLLKADDEAAAAAAAETIVATPETTPEAAAGTPAAGAPETAQATNAPPMQVGALSEAAKAFGETVMGALDKLLAVHTGVVLTEVYAKLSAMATQTSNEIAAQIESGMRAAVHRMVESELGGPIPLVPDVPAPVAAAAAAAVDATPQPEPAPRALKVDVVGLHNGAMEQQVRAAFNGNTELRFFDPDSRNGYAPHRGRHCIVVTQRIPHTLKHKIKAAGIEPIYVKSTTGHVIHAIEELHRAVGVGMH